MPQDATAIEPTQLTHPRYRADIDGLRAIAVLSVVGFHAFPGLMRGGFVGVDVFFVISGFLISSIILPNLGAGGFSFAAFYSRRIKRIFPALIIVLATCYVIGWFVLLSGEYAQLGKHIFAGAGFASNFILWSESGYFDNAADTKPLLHLWSLGIEEQFYIAWPLLLWWGWKRRCSLLWLTLTLLAASFVFNVYRIRADQVGVFYSPLTRMWQLLAGATLAYLSLHGVDMYSAVRGRMVRVIGVSGFSNAQSLFGAAAIAIGILVISTDRLFPGWWALLPTLGACLLIAAGPAAIVNRTLLANRVLVWFGLISYPLYLWHWPLLSFARIVESARPDRSIRIAAVLASIGLAWLTYRFIEMPIRRGGGAVAKVIVLVVLMVVVALVGYDLYRREGFPLRENQEIANQFIGKFPESLGCVANHPYAEGASCYASPKQYAKTVLVLGDSHGEAFAPGFVRAFEGGRLPYNLLIVAKGGCMPFANTEFFQDTGMPHECRKVFLGALNNAISDKEIVSVIIIARHAWRVETRGFGEIEKDESPHSWHYSYDNGRVTTKLSSEAYSLGLADTLNLLTRAGKQVIFVDQLPELGFEPKACVRRSISQFFKSGGEDGRCEVSVAAVEQRQARYRKIVASVLPQFPQVGRFDPTPYLCHDGRCSPMQGGRMMYRDDDHISAMGAEFLAAEIVRLIKN